MGVPQKIKKMTKVVGTAASGWGCPHETSGSCQLRRTECQPGMVGCVLYGLVTILGEKSPKS